MKTGKWLCWTSLVFLPAVVLFGHEPRQSGFAIDPAAMLRQTENDVVATVGPVKIIERDVIASLPPELRKKLDSALLAQAENETEAVRALITDRCVREESRKRGISEQALYHQELEKNRGQIPKSFRGPVLAARESIYQTKREALGSVIDKTLVELEARERRISPDELFDVEIAAKAGVPTAAEVELIVDYELARQRTSRPREELRKQVEQVLREKRLEQRQHEYLTSLRQKRQIRTLLEPPRVAVTADDDPILGPPDAPVKVVVFSEFQCPFCARVEPVLERIRAHYGDDVAVVFRDFPLANHQHAMQAAVAANCARQQGKYWEYHKSLFANQADLAPESLVGRAESLGLDRAAFAQCLDSAAMRREVEHDMADAEEAGVSGTPTLFVNGRLFTGAPEFRELAAIIDEELQKRESGAAAGSE